MLDVVRAKPKPVRVLKKRKKDNPYCKCKYLSVNEADYKSCAKCKKLLKTRDLHKALDRLLDSYVKRIVLLRDGFCVCSAPDGGHGTKRQPGHLITRGKESVKWDLRNVNEQCDSCNILHEHYPHRYNNWYSNRFGQEAYNALCADGDRTWKLSMDEMEALLEQLKLIYAAQLANKDFKPRFSQKEILSGEWRK